MKFLIALGAIMLILGIVFTVRGGLAGAVLIAMGAFAIASGILWPRSS